MINHSLSAGYCARSIRILHSLLTILLTTYYVGENGVRYQMKYHIMLVKTGSRYHMKCQCPSPSDYDVMVVQFCICDLVQHEIESGQTDGRTDGHIIFIYLS